MIKPEIGNLSMNPEILEETLRESLAEIRYIQKAIADKNYTFALNRLEDFHNELYDVWQHILHSIKGDVK